MSFYRQGPHRGSGGVTIGVPPLTPMIKIIIIVCGAVWVVQFLAFLVFESVALTRLFGLIPRRVLTGFVWQPLTYMWLHSPRDIMHVLFNMLFLWLLGGDLERRWGARGFLRYYLVCGIGAAPFIIAAGFLSPGGQGFDAASAVTVGASGAIFGIVLAFGMVFAERTILFMLLFPMRARTFAIVMFVVAFVSTVNASPTGVSHIAHVGGMVVGYLYLKRAWRVGEFVGELRWKLKRRRFKVIPPKDDDPWIN